MPGPDSSYSCLLHQRFWKVLREAVDEVRWEIGHDTENQIRTQDGTTDPDGVLPLGRGDDLDLHGGRAQGSQLLLHSVRDTGVHGGTAGENDVSVEITTDIKIALEDGVVAADSGEPRGMTKL